MVRQLLGSLVRLYPAAIVLFLHFFFPPLKLCSYFVVVQSEQNVKVHQKCIHAREQLVLYRSVELVNAVGVRNEIDYISKMSITSWTRFRKIFYSIPIVMGGFSWTFVLFRCQMVLNHFRGTSVNLIHVQVPLIGQRQTTEFTLAMVIQGVPEGSHIGSTNLEKDELRNVFPCKVRFQSLSS